MALCIRSLITFRKITDQLMWIHDVTAAVIIIHYEASA